MTRETSESTEFGVGVCAACGSTIDTTVWRPSTTRTADDGKPRMYMFCDEQCRARWSATDAGTE